MEIKPLQEEDFVQMVQIFQKSECLTNIGRATNQPLLKDFGEAYVREAIMSGDLSSYKALCSVFRNPKCEFWGLRDETSQSLIGSIALEFKDCDTAELRRMCVAEKFRRRGLGTMLVQHFLKFAQDQGYKKVFLTTPSVNVGAIAMYERSGFVRNEDVEFKGSDLGPCTFKLAHLSCQL